MILIFLQNAWAKDVRSARAMESRRRLWLWATANSRSGKRLKVMLGPECFSNERFVLGNTTPVCGVGPDSKLPVDEQHIASLIAEHKPSLVIACGLQAESALTAIWAGSLLCVPHPASRLLTDKLLLKARRILKSHSTNGPRFRLALRQRNGFVERVDLMKAVPA